jgi:endonuclease/exonuclease/phosphatase family metal-dependent hydrolase
MKHIFWNVNKNIAINQLICDLMVESQCDIISLAEYIDNTESLLCLLAKIGLRFYAYPCIGCKRITILSKYDVNQIEQLADDNFYTLKRFPHSDLGSIIIAFVHFPSKLHAEDVDYIELACSLRNDIENIETRLDDRKTIIVGDFNMNPFENGMTSAAALHSIPWAKQAQKLKRVIRDRTYYFFYNPMWNLLGDYIPPAGSFYYQKSISNCIYWNIFDQVNIRPCLIDNFDVSKIKFITQIKELVLTKHSGIPDSNISDHLPLYFEL